jgi:branched-chain amino acid transport system substrate-binding protein
VAIEEQNARCGIAGRRLILLSSAFLGAFGMEFPDVIRSLGPAAEGVYGTTAWQPGIAAPGQEAESQAFVEAFAKRFGLQAAPLAMHGYAPARALLASLENAARKGRPLTGPGLRDALAAVDVMTPMGRARFEERGDPVSYERVIPQIQDGRHVVVWPKERAQAAAR